MSFKEVLAKQFRVGTLQAEQSRVFQQCLYNCAAAGAPVEFCIPIGGYKKWRLSAFPEADWAEFFQLSFMRDLALRIASRHQPGAIVTYLWDNLAAAEININQFPPQSILDYQGSLQRLVAYINSLCSGRGITFSVKRITDYYDRERYLSRFQDMFSRAEAFWIDEGNSDVVRALEDRTRVHFYCRNGEPDYPAIRKSAQQIWAHSQVFAGPVFADVRTQIPVILRDGPPQYLHLRSCHSSEVQFWVGTGVIIIGRHRLYPSILSSDNPSDYRAEAVVPTPEFSRLGRNFSHIRVLRKLDDAE